MMRCSGLLVAGLMLLVGCSGIRPMHQGHWVHERAEANRRPQKEEAPLSPVVKGNKRLFVVIDDAGLIERETQQFLDLPMPLTLAVLPHQRHTASLVRRLAARPDKEYILHQPMEATGGNNPGLAAILNDTPPDAVAIILRENLASVKGAAGMNNHMGSLVTENEALLEEILRYCQEHDLFFLDSKTSYNSKVSIVAERLGMTVAVRTDFLDIQHDRASIQRAWERTVARAEREGEAIAIGHVWSDATAEVILESYGDLTARGFTFHLLSEWFE
jgi:uncharacterized protein